MFRKVLGMTSAVILAIGLTACGGNNDTNDEDAFVGEKVDYTIVGIDPGAGIMEQADDMMSEYGLEGTWEIQGSSGAAMTAELTRAIDEEEPIIVTGWIPHWKFFEFDLKMLEDPKEVFGGEEFIHTIVRDGLKDDMPGVYTFFDQFEWEPEDMQEVMLKIEEGLSEQEAAEEWVEDNEELVNSWIEGAEPGDGTEVKVPYVAWADVIASSNVIKYVLEDKLDYTVDLMQVEPGPMFASVADGSTDAMVGAWLPSTHEAYLEEYGDDFEDLGVNLTGTRNGLVVPTYMDIESIEDLIEDE